jgi:uncharacterized protein YqgC (DUF456 family)
MPDFHAILQSVDWSAIGVWSLTIILLVTGLLGAIIPFLPGPFLLFLAGVLHSFLRPESGVSWWGIGILGLLLALAYAVDFASGMMGARWFGASRWGVLGVFAGGLLGMFFSLPGLIIGPLAGGFAFELFFARKEMRPAIKSTWGTLVGTTLGMVLRIAVSAAMIVVFLVDALWW